MAEKRSAPRREAAATITLSNLKPAPGSTQSRKRVGRGPGSGLGKTSGKGHKGHKARTGGGTNPGFEGGQMPLYRRLPKRGFTNPFREEHQVVRLSELYRVGEGNEVTIESLFEAGLIRANKGAAKLLANGEITHAVTVRGVKVSSGAREKILAAGGRVEE